MKMIFLGAPGAGKGTQAEMVSEKYAIPAISTGAIIREAIKNQNEMGREASTYTEKGALVPDEVVIGIIKERLMQEDCKNGFILDGFPRTVPQAKALENMGISIDLVINIEVPDEKIIERMSGRRVCAGCQATYHTIYKPSKDNETCDRCGGKLTIRKDDSPEIVASRLETYHEQTEPLIDYYKNLGKLETIQGQEELSDTTSLTLALIDNKARQIINHDIG
jgi:adenylate kinase